MKKSAILILILLFLAPAFALAVTEEKKVAKEVAHELLEVSGVIKIGPQVTNQLIKIRRKTMPDIPEQFWQEFSGEVDPGELNKKIIPIYVKHFTVDEMKAIIAFYKTDVGQKLLGELPKITRESMKAARQWSIELRTKLTDKLKTADLKGMKK